MSITPNPDRRARYAAAIAEGFRAFDADTTADAHLDADLLDAVVAAVEAELAEVLAAVSVVPPATNQTALLAEDLRYVLGYTDPGHAHEEPGVWDTSGKPCGHCARLAVARQNLAAYDGGADAVLPAPVDQAAVLREAVAAIDRLRATLSPSTAHRYESGLGLAATELRRLAVEAVQAGGPSRETTEEQPDGDDTVHACPGRWAGPSCTCFDPEPVQPAAEAPHTATPGEALCICGHPTRQHFEDACLLTGCDCGDCLELSALPEALEAALTKRFTALGNPFSEMRRHEQGPDGWPSSRPVGPHQVAEVLRELLTAAPAVVAQPGKETDRG